MSVPLSVQNVTTIRQIFKKPYSDTMQNSIKVVGKQWTMMMLNDILTLLN